MASTTLITQGASPPDDAAHGGTHCPAPQSRSDTRMLYALAAGLTVKEVAILEGVTRYRVENRLRKLRARYEARTTTELVAMAIGLAWIPAAHRR